MRLWLIRHALVPKGVGRCYGISDLLACDDATQAAADALAQTLPRHVPMWVSGLTRSQQLASALQYRRPDLGAARIEPRLNEMDFGRWEMQLWNDVSRQEIDDWIIQFPRYRFGGKESAQDVIERVAVVLDDFRKAGVTEGVLVTHAGVIRAVQFLHAHGLREIAGTHEWPRQSVAPGTFLELDV